MYLTCRSIVDIFKIPFLFLTSILKYLFICCFVLFFYQERCFGFSEEKELLSFISVISICMLCNFLCFCCGLLIFSKLTFSENSFRNIIRVSNGLDSDQNRHSGSKLFAEVMGKGQHCHLQEESDLKFAVDDSFVFCCL